LQHGPILDRDRIGPLAVVVAGEVDDDWLGSENVQLNGAGVAVLEVGEPFSPGHSTELCVGRGEAASDRAES
jgi:hypothetical protein